MAVATGGGAVYVGGMVTGTLGTPLPGTTPGGLDGFLASSRPRSPLGRSRSAPLPTSRSGASPPTRPATRRSRATRAATCSRRSRATRHRRRDVRPGRRGHASRPARHDRQRPGASVALDGAGNTYVSGFSDGNLETNIGNFDAVLVKYGPGLTRLWARQLATRGERRRRPVRRGQRVPRDEGLDDLGRPASRWAARSPRRRPATATSSYVVRRRRHEPRLDARGGRAAPAVLPSGVPHILGDAAARELEACRRRERMSSGGRRVEQGPKVVPPPESLAADVVGTRYVVSAGHHLAAGAAAACSIAAATRSTRAWRAGWCSTSSSRTCATSAAWRRSSSGPPGSDEV